MLTKKRILMGNQKTWLEKINPLSAFLDTAETKYAKSRNLWIQIIRDSDSATLDVGYDSTSRAAALAWSVGTSSYKCKRYNQISGKADITISSSSDQELIITGGAWVNNTAKYCLFEPSKSTLSVMDTLLSVNGRMKNLSMAAYIIQKDDKNAVTGYISDYVFPIKCSAGPMDFSISNGINVFWYLFGGSISTADRPAATLGAGVSYVFATNMLSSIINANNIGNQYIGKVVDLPNLNYILYLQNTLISGNIIDLPRSFIILMIDGSLLDGNVSDLPVVLITLGINGCNIEGNLEGAPTPNLQFWGGWNNFNGIYHPHPACNWIWLNDTAMTPNDTDQTLIYLADNTTVASGGTLHIKSNRTSASDAAVASLAGKFTITEV